MGDINYDKVVPFNEDQRDHEIIFTKLCWIFVNDIMKDALSHDRSKWSINEYETFLNARDSLKSSKDGKDEEYQKVLKEKALDHHYENNPHHPEYWEPGKMPLTQIVMMFFDWSSRTIQKGETLDGFWSYNIEKLKKTKQDHAIPIVIGLKEKYGDIIVKLGEDFEKGIEI